MSRTSKRPAKVFSEPVSVPRSYDVLAEKLRETILDGNLPEGARLPTERELVLQTGLSRGSVREALRKLEVEGLVKARPGRLGGNIVSRPTNEAIAQFLGQFVRGRRLSLRTLQETRETIEPTLARLAAERRLPEDLERLRNINTRMADPAIDRARFATFNAEWHNAVADAARNELLAALLHSMSDPLVSATVFEEYDNADLRRSVTGIHAEILAAIEARDGDAAYRRMERHVKAARAMAREREERGLTLE